MEFVKKYGVVGLFLVSVLSAFGQNYKYRTFGLDEGLFQPFIYTVNQDKHGYLWVGTGEGLMKYNGVSFAPVFKGDSLAESFIASSYVDDDGLIWYGHQNGGISTFDGDEFDILDVKNLPPGQVNSIVQDQNGEIWYIIQGNGVVHILPDGKMVNFTTEFKRLILYDIAFTTDGLLVAATNEGIILYEISDAGFPRKVRLIDELPVVQINDIEPDSRVENKFWIASSDEGVHWFTLNYDKKDYLQTGKIGERYGLNDAYVKSTNLDKEGNLWISTYGKGLYKANYSKKHEDYLEFVPFNKANGLPSNDVNLVFKDREDNIWVGTHGASLVQILDNFFEIHTVSDTLTDKNVYSIHIDDKARYLGVDGGVIVEPLDTSKTQLINTEQGLPSDVVTAIYKDNDGNLWIGTEKNGTYVKYKDAENVESLDLSDDLLSKSVNVITGSNQFIWIGTKFGLFKYNKISKQNYRYSTENELNHNNISHMYKDPGSHDIWIATQSNYLTRIRGKEIEDFEITNSYDILKITSIVSDYEGNIWFGTYGDGVYMYDYKEFHNLGMSDGLHSDYCYSLVVDQNNYVWVGHRGGITRIRPKDKYIKVYDVEDGFRADCNLNAIHVDDNNNVWFGTNIGVIRYDPQRDKRNTIAPLTNIIGITITSDNQDNKVVKDNIELGYGAYKVRFDFIGLSFANSSEITYEYKLEGHDIDWTTSSSNYALYNRLEEGTYKFKVRACNSDGFCSEETSNVNIVINAPYWKQWWFIASVSAVFVYAVFFFIKYREKRQKRFQRFLQKELNERTAEVIAQRDELERKNKDITDSINYAKRIQSAILPKDNKLDEVLPGSFIFFRPRDIVSGDFYWFNSENGKAVIACADATGHGVPGAFMSMIGSTILQDAMNRSNVKGPDDILYELDQEIKKLLSSDDKNEDPKDGMDISVVEIDLNTRRTKVASAMRPFVIFRNSEMVYLKGSRNAVGGGYGNMKKEFLVDEFDLEGGDMIYLFSDGYPDQFGGPEGKKFKVSRLKDLFEFMHEMEGNKQFNILSNNFDKWTENYAQIDDVLVMGIRI